MRIQRHVQTLQDRLPQVFGIPRSDPYPWPQFDPELQDRYLVDISVVNNPPRDDEDYWDPEDDFAAIDSLPIDVPPLDGLRSEIDRLEEYDFSDLGAKTQIPQNQTGPRGTTGSHAGTNVRSPAGSSTPPPAPHDVDAWYQPFHFFPNDWGIFIKETAIERIALFIFGIAIGMGAPPPNQRTLWEARRAAFLVLFRHEFFHHKVECFATRMEVFMRLPAYGPQFHARHWLLEEALANAFAYRDIEGLKGAASKALCREVRDAAAIYQLLEFQTAPPGYRDAVRFLQDQQFNYGNGYLHEQVRLWTVGSGPVQPPDIWTSATYRDAPWVRINLPCYVIVDRLGGHRWPMRFRTWRRRELEKILRTFGITITEGRGPHSTLRDTQGNTLPPLPRHRTISPGVARKVIRSLGISERQAHELLT